MMKTPQPPHPPRWTPLVQLVGVLLSAARLALELARR